MNAKELRDKFLPESDRDTWVISDKELKATILRALDLLARVEESEDELVRELRRPRVSHHQISADGDPYETATRTHPVDPVRLKAAARIVAQDERIKALEAERDIYKAHILSAPKEEA